MQGASVFQTEARGVTPASSLPKYGEIRVSLQALQRNARTLRSLAQPAKAAFVVKSNAYGHGLVPVARAVEKFAHKICVYAFEEAVVLREAGLAAPIFVMGPVRSGDLEESIERGFEISIWDTGSYLRSAAAAARKRGARLAVHLKIDTGVSRLGIDPLAALETVEAYARFPEIELTGVFSHLAAAEELDSPFTLGQLETFERALRSVEPVFEMQGVRPTRHIAASAAAMLWPQTRLDMARFGIALYGLWPSAQTQQEMNGAGCVLEPALSFVSRLAAVREVEAGTPIGYGCSYHAAKRTRIGVVPLGYADGIPRLLSNRGAFVVCGARCPIVGRVCMNMTMLDLDAAPAARVGDEVVLIGTGPGQDVSADDWAAWAQTINYEIVARLPEHLSRSFRYPE